MRSRQFVYIWIQIIWTCKIISNGYLSKSKSFVNYSHHAVKQHIICNYFINILLLKLLCLLLLYSPARPLVFLEQQGLRLPIFRTFNFDQQIPSVIADTARIRRRRSKKSRPPIPKSPDWMIPDTPVVVTSRELGQRTRHCNPLSCALSVYMLGSAHSLGLCTRLFIVDTFWLFVV